MAKEEIEDKRSRDLVVDAIKEINKIMGKGIFAPYSPSMVLVL